jgi:uncharacterized protein (TIGR02757 family)
MRATNKYQPMRDVLEVLYSKYNRHSLIPPDPLQFIYRFSQPADMEIAGLLSALLATGRVEQIQKSLIKLFGIIGKSPCQFVIHFDESKRNRLKEFKHRFTTGDDIADLMILLKQAIKQSGSIEKYFLLGYNKTDENIIPALTQFCNSLFNNYAAENHGKISRGVKYLLASPTGGSGCKRINLFLRWMVRKDSVDTGLWQSVDKAKLIVPIDVHMNRLCKILGFHNDKTTSIKTAIKITSKFAEIVPDDPVKYDFALSRIGIVEDCTGRYRPQCENCELFGFCCKRFLM